MTSLGVYELNELHESVAERIGDLLMPILSRANRTGELPQLLKLLCMSDLIGDSGYLETKTTKVVVLGDSEVKGQKLKSIARKRGFDSERFEFCLEYDRLKHFDFARLRDTLTYKAVMVGPMPHSTPGKFGSSSAIAEMENHPDTCPRVIQLRSANELKITNNSFVAGLDELAVAN